MRIVVVMGRLTRTPRGASGAARSRLASGAVPLGDRARQDAFVAGLACASIVSGMHPRHLRTPGALRRATTLGCVLLLGVLGACSGAPEPPQEPSYDATSLADFDASAVTLERTDFCDDFSEEAVQYTVGEVASTKHYGNGDPVQLTEGVRDVSHELNCTFVGKSGTTARAWVFVPRVTAQRAEELVNAAGQAEGCSRVEGREFGEPSTGRFCTTGEGVEASYRGLFVDTWLTCSVSRPAKSQEKGSKEMGKAQPDRESMLREAGEWCTAAAEAASSKS